MNLAITKPKVQFAAYCSRVRRGMWISPLMKMEFGPSVYSYCISHRPCHEPIYFFIGFYQVEEP